NAGGWLRIQVVAFTGTIAAHAGAFHDPKIRRDRSRRRIRPSDAGGTFGNGNISAGDASLSESADSRHARAGRDAALGHFEAVARNQDGPGEGGGGTRH